MYSSYAQRRICFCARGPLKLSLEAKPEEPLEKNTLEIVPFSTCRALCLVCPDTDQHKLGRIARSPRMTSGGQDAWLAGLGWGGESWGVAGEQAMACVLTVRKLDGISHIPGIIWARSQELVSCGYPLRASQWAGKRERETQPMFSCSTCRFGISPMIQEWHTAA